MQQIPLANTSVTEPAPLATLQACAAQLLEVTPAVMRAIRAYMRAEGAHELSVPQFRALSYIGRHPGTSLSEVADHIGLTVAAASRLVDGLVGRHLVERTAAAQDRRFIALQLSSAGVALWQAARQAAQSALAERLATLDAAAIDVIMQAQTHLRQLFAGEPQTALGSTSPAPAAEFEYPTGEQS